MSVVASGWCSNCKPTCDLLFICIPETDEEDVGIASIF